MPIRYMGSQILTIVLENGSDLDESKCETPYGGTIVFQRPATLTIEGVIVGAELRIYDDLGTTTYGTELAGTETTTQTFFGYSHDGTINDVIIQMMASGYEEVRLPFQVNNTNQTVTLVPGVENND